MAAFPTRLRRVPGVSELLDALETPGCVAPSGDLDRIELCLGITNLAGHFEPDRLFSTQMVAHAKPAPDLFLRSAEQCAADPTGCLVVEDSPHGVAAARAAGMDVVGFVGGGHAGPLLGARLESAGADVVLGDPSGLLTLLSGLAGPGAAQ